MMKTLLYQDRTNIKRILLNIYTEFELIEGQLYQNTSFSKAGQLQLGEWNKDLIITYLAKQFWVDRFYSTTNLFTLPSNVFFFATDYKGL